MSNKKRISRFAKEKKILGEIKSLRLGFWIKQLENAMLRKQMAIIVSQRQSKSYPPGGFISDRGAEKILGRSGNVIETEARNSWNEYFEEKAKEDKRPFLRYLEDEIKTKFQNPGETHSGEAENFF